MPACATTIAAIFGTDINDADGGNPRLDPYRTNQYDASLEWYFSEASAVSFAVFHKDIGNFVTNSMTIDSTIIQY